MCDDGVFRYIDVLSAKIHSGGDALCKVFGELPNHSLKRGLFIDPLI